MFFDIWKRHYIFLFLDLFLAVQEVIKCVNLFEIKDRASFSKVIVLAIQEALEKVYLIHLKYLFHDTYFS